MMDRDDLTAGDPAGIGPEIARKAMADARVRSVCEPLFYGSHQHFPPGVLSADAGRAAYDTIVRAVRDARAVERKKPGRPKARKRFQFSKR